VGTSEGESVGIGVGVNVGTGVDRQSATIAKSDNEDATIVDADAKTGSEFGAGPNADREETSTVRVCVLMM